MKPIIKEIYKNSRFIKNFMGIKLVINSFSKKDYARYNVALKLDTPFSILIRLSRDKYDWVRSAVAQHPTFIKYKT